jgi:hypothetical protein
MQYRKILYNLMSWATGKERRVDNILSMGDWRFFQINNYTSASPLVVNQGATTKITYQPTDIFFTVGRDLTINYDYTSQRFFPQTLNDVFLVEVRFKAKSSAQNSAYEIRLDSPTFAYNPVQAQSGSVVKSANVEQFISLAVPVFIGPEIIVNGLEVYFKAESGNFSVYDVSFMIVKLSSGIV